MPAPSATASAREPVTVPAPPPVPSHRGNEGEERQPSEPEQRADTTNGGQRSVRVLQANLNNCKAAHDLLLQTLAEKNIEVALVSEPYLKKSGGPWVIADNGEAGVWVKDPRAARLLTPKTEGMVGVYLGDLLLVNVYHSPNLPAEGLQTYLDTVGNAIRGKEKVVVGGDLNAKSVMWEEHGGNTREEKLRAETAEAFIAQKELHVGNQGKVATCVRNNGESIVDVTLATTRVEFVGWRVLFDETHSDHRYIEFGVLCEGAARERPETTAQAEGWKVTKDTLPELERAFRTNFERMALGESTSAEEAVERYLKVVVDTCNDVLLPRKKFVGRKSVYWWNDDIRRKRSECAATRRRLKRKRRGRRNEDEVREIEDELRSKKKILRAAISNSKRDKWKDLTKGLNEDPWSMAYRIAMGKLGNQTGIGTVDNEEAVRELFPRDEEDWYSMSDESELRRVSADEDGPEPFTPEEMDAAIGSVKKKKSPGPDNIVGDIAKAAFAADPDRLLDLYNRCLAERSFPKVWKTGRLVLIPKPNSTKVRPIIMLSVFGKIYEKLINNRIKRELEEKAALSDMQFGFREGRSTGDALKVLKKKMRGARSGKRFCVVVSFDVRNAFNTIRWGSILHALKKVGLSDYLRDVVREYGNERTLLYHGAGGELKEYMTNRGVPQGSVLGPTLWIIAYDAVLRIAESADRLIVGFADDTLLIVTGPNHVVVEDMANETIGEIRMEVEDIGCSFAPEKTQAVLVSPKRVVSSIRIVVAGTVVPISRSFKYLGVIVDDKLTFGEHVKYVTDKTKKVCKNLARITGNLKGPKERKRKLYTTVVNQVILYAAPVWSPGLAQRHKDKLNAVQRLANLRQVQGYVTVSGNSASALAGNPPADLLADETARIEELLRNRRRARTTAERAAAKAVRINQRKLTEEIWNERWRTEVDNWTKRLCDDVRDVNRRHMRNTFRTTQMLTGKGVFNRYRCDIRKSDSPRCWYCPNEEDTAEHTMFKCGKWASERRKLQAVVSDFRPKGDLIARLTGSRAAWKAFAKFAEVVMAAKEEEERRVEALAREQRRREQARRCTVL